MRRWLFIALILFVVKGFAISDSAITHFKLDNGLKVVLIENHRAPTVFSSIWYRVGGSYEPDGLTGISHMLEHMMFKGTTEYPDGFFKTKVAEMGGTQNAITSNDFTMYYQQIPADKLSNVLALEADRMQHLSPTQSSFENEHRVVMEERRMRIEDNPQGLTWLRFMSAAFINSPYHQPVIGWLPDIKQYTLQDVMAWYHQWYAPNNAELIIMGDFNSKSVYQLIQRHFGPIPHKALPVMKARSEIPSLGPREIQVHAPAQLPWLVMGYSVPALSQLPANKQWQAYALYLAAAALSEGDSSRLTKQLVRDQQVAISASAHYAIYDLHRTAWVLYGTPSSTVSCEQLKDKLLQQVKQLQGTLLSTQELERIKTQVLASYVYRQDSYYEQVLALGQAEMAGLSWQDAVAFDEHIQAVTPQQIQFVAAHYLLPNDLTTAVLHPSKIAPPPSVKPTVSGDLS